MQRLCAIPLICFALCGGSVHAQYVADNRIIPAAIEDTSNGMHRSLPATPSAPTPWQKEEDRVFGHIRNSRLTKMKRISAGIISLFQDSILTGDALHPIWHGEYFPAAGDGPQLRFGVNCVFPRGQDHARGEDGARGQDPTSAGSGLTNAGSDLTSAGSDLTGAGSDLTNAGSGLTGAGSDITVFANDISPLLGRHSVNGHVFITLKAMTGDAGHPYFEFDLPAADAANGDAGRTTSGSVHVKAWLVTADSSRLPFLPVTRKEYLEEARQELEGRRAVIVANTKENITIRPAAEQEAERRQALQQLRDTYSGADLQTRTRIYLNNYRKDEDYMTRTIAARTAALDNTIGLIDSLLRYSTAQQLALPANVSADAVDFQGFEDGRANSSVLIRLRPSFYNAQAAGERESRRSDAGQPVLRSLLICWRYDPADPASAPIDRQLAGNAVWRRFHSAFTNVCQ